MRKNVNPLKLSSMKKKKYIKIIQLNEIKCTYIKIIELKERKRTYIEITAH